MMQDGCSLGSRFALKHSILLKQDSTVWVSGSNSYGQFSDDSTISSSLFMQGVTQSSGADHDVKIVCCRGEVLGYPMLLVAYLNECIYIQDK